MDTHYKKILIEVQDRLLFTVGAPANNPREGNNENQLRLQKNWASKKPTSSY
jgi:hypothetical protein